MPEKEGESSYGQGYNFVFFPNKEIVRFVSLNYKKE